MKENSLCTATDDQGDPVIHSAVVVWEDYRSGTDNDIYGIRLFATVYLPIVVRHYGP